MCGYVSSGFVLTKPLRQGTEEVSWLDYWASSPGSLQCKWAEAVLWASSGCLLYLRYLQHWTQPPPRGNSFQQLASTTSFIWTLSWAQSCWHLTSPPGQLMLHFPTTVNRIPPAILFLAQNQDLGFGADDSSSLPAKKSCHLQKEVARIAPCLWPYLLYSVLGRLF